jgi:dihydropteroate synthase
VTLLARVGELAGLGCAVLVGPSRKRFLGVITGTTPDDLAARDAATLGACCAAVARGADIVRVHRVEGVRAALAVVDAVRAADAVP